MLIKLSDIGLIWCVVLAISFAVFALLNIWIARYRKLLPSRRREIDSTRGPTKWVAIYIGTVGFLAIGVSQYEDYYFTHESKLLYALIAAMAALSIFFWVWLAYMLSLARLCRRELADRHSVGI